MTDDLRVGLGGFGAIGMAVARRLDSGIPGLALAAISARDRAAAKTRAGALGAAPLVVPANELPEHADIVVECAPAAVFDDIAIPALRAGRIFVPASVGALLGRRDLVALATERGARIIVPTGALIGLDAVRAAAEGTITRVTMVTRKPPASLAGAPYLVANAIDLSGLDAPLKIFEGDAGAAARGFPANVNVAAALSLAGIGPDATRIEIWADPALTRNTHSITVESDAANFSMTIENLPSPENPRTGLITAQSVVACLRGLVAPLHVGT